MSVPPVMAATTLTLDMPQRLTFETAAAHVTKEVPIAEPTARVRQILEALTERSYKSASHVVVCRAGRFLGIVTIEDLFRASVESTVEALMDREVPFVAPGIDQELAAWHAVRHGESALAVVDQEGRFIGVIPAHRLLAVLLAELV